MIFEARNHFLNEIQFLDLFISSLFNCIVKSAKCPTLQNLKCNRNYPSQCKWTALRIGLNQNPYQKDPIGLPLWPLPNWKTIFSANTTQIPWKMIHPCLRFLARKMEEVDGSVQLSSTVVDPEFECISS